MENKRVLIIDDDLYLRDLYKEILEGEGFQVTTAIDGEDGLKYLLEGGYCLVLLDIMMPKLDGIGLLTKLKESSPKQNNGPIIILTNLAHDPAIEEALKLGAKSAYIKADLTPPQLIEKIKSHLTPT